MKLLLENWREYVKQEVESFLPGATVRDINMIGSSTLSPEEQDRQDMEKYGHIQAERDIDIEVKVADITREEAEEWAFSNEAERLEMENNYDVQLTIVENWRKYLNEVSFSDAKEILDSKRTLKIIKAYRYEKEQEDPDYQDSGDSIRSQHRNFKNYLLDMVPDDLTDNQKGTSILWLIKMSREDPKVAANFINGRITVGPRQSLETFFHHQRFMPNQDLMQIKTMGDLVAMTYAAKEEIQKAQDKKNYLDAGEGTEIFRDDSKWTIAALHNKGAACELGKNTDWCTAAPGLDYFEDYYKPEDPLFYFQNKSNLNKFQFHYGSSQFMNSKDERLDKESFEVLHDLLIETEAWNKYEILRIFDLKRMIQIRLVEGPGSQALIDEMREILNSLKDPYGMANTLAEMATMDHFNIPTYVLRWLASEEFYEYTGVARRIIKYHDIVPSDILEDIAENNPNERTRVMAQEVLDKRGISTPAAAGLRGSQSTSTADPHGALQEHFKKFRIRISK